MGDIYKFLGMERKNPVVHSQEFCEYRLWCSECGDKSAAWLVDNPTPALIRNSFKRQYEMVTYPSHGDHGTFTILEEKHSPYNE